jgi:beta-galactosidase
LGSAAWHAPSRSAKQGTKYGLSLRAFDFYPIYLGCESAGAAGVLRAKVRAVQAQEIAIEPQASRARLSRSGIDLGGRQLPLLSGSMHYWRIEPDCWRSGLEALRSLGCTMVDTYVPWSVHELERGKFDFGQHDAQKDVAAFLRLAHEVGLHALVRPGPHINAELNCFGVPKRVIWAPECQARSAGGAPVVLPMPPLAFPVPSYASRRFLNEAAQWLNRVAEELGSLTWPSGPIVLCQIDNEGSLYFRDGVYDQDYHPDSLARYRARLAHQYGTPAMLAQTYGSEAPVSFEAIEPPRRFDAVTEGDLARHLDWAEHQEALIEEAFVFFRQALQRAGLEHVPTCHNLPMAESATPLDPARIGRVVECLGIDYYHAASEHSAEAIARRTSELVTRADAFNYPAFASELAAGFPPYYVPLTEPDNKFAALSCLSAGIRGFNVYMAVERDRWIGAPIDRFGTRRPFADFWEKLNRAVLRARLFELRQAADVCLIVPRSLHRLERMLHAFGPLSPAAFDVLGLSAQDACLEQGPFASSLFEAERFLHALMLELSTRGISHAFAGNDAAAHALAQCRFGIVISAFGLEPELWETLKLEAARGKSLSFGPRLPTTSPSGLSPLPPPSEGEISAKRLSLIAADRVGEALDELCLQHAPRTLTPGRGLRSSLFVDDAERPRVLFVTNATPEPQIATLAGGLASEARDALDEQLFRATLVGLEIPMAPRSVRMLELG